MTGWIDSSPQDEAKVLLEYYTGCVSSNSAFCWHAGSLEVAGTPKICQVSTPDDLFRTADFLDF